MYKTKDLENPLWDEFELESDHSQPLLTLGKSQYFKNETEDDTINGFINNPVVVTSIDDLGVEDTMEGLSLEHMKTTPNLKRNSV